MKKTIEQEKIECTISFLSAFWGVNDNQSKKGKEAVLDFLKRNYDGGNLGA